MDLISTRINKHGSWEKNIVNNVIKAMKAFPSAVFLDVGANIGMYTVMIAAMKRNVIAVDADSKNLAYIRQSLDMAKTADYVELIYNAIRLLLETTQIYLKLIMSMVQ